MGNLVRLHRGSAYKVGNVLVPIDRTGLVGFWPFEEGSGNTAYDESKNGNSGTIYGASWTYDSHFGYALDFDGTDDYVDLNVDPSYSEGTISFWIDPVNPAGTLDEHFATVIDSTFSEDIQLFNYSDGNTYYDLKVDGTRYRISTGDSFPSGYFLITYTWDLSNNYFEVFWNTTSKGTDSPSGSLDIGYDLIVGARNDAGTIGHFYEGKIDDPRIYDRALSENEIANIYQKTKP